MLLTKYLHVKKMVVLGLLWGLTGTANAAVITVGVDLPLSGTLKPEGEAAQHGLELLENQVNARGGIRIGEQNYQFALLFKDNYSNASGAANAALKLISSDHVLGLIGPLVSGNAIPVGNICNSFRIPMISPSSTNPATTLHRPYVFRACFVDTFQGEVMARFAVTEFKAGKATVLYNGTDVYSKGLAHSFKSAFEEKKGGGAVVTFAGYLDKDIDLQNKITRVVDSGADVLFLPEYASDLPRLLEQIHAAGWHKPILGGDGWDSPRLKAACKGQCAGAYFTGHFSATGLTGKAADFVERYQKQYKSMPDGYSALAYDAGSLMVAAISQLDTLEENVMITRQAIREQLVGVKEYPGVSGVMSLNETGNPEKRALVLHINNAGAFEQYQVINP